MKIWSLTILAALTFVAAVVVLNWQAIALGLSISSSDVRPALLSDARWNDPPSAHKFNSRFAHGTATGKLINWLNGNGFEVHSHLQRAERVIQSLPCNEWIVVSWQSDGSGHLTEAIATVSEKGCL